MGFGGGAMIGAPMNEALLKYWSTPPAYLGELPDVPLKTIDGVRYAIGEAGETVQVVVASGADLLSSTLDLHKWAGQLGDLSGTGVYAVGTGDTGAVSALKSAAQLHGD